MKKEYVKPVIESEEFVANEYVAACWHVSCPHTSDSWPFTCKYEPWDIKNANSVEDYIENNSIEAKVIHNGGHFPYEETSSYYHNTDVQTVHHKLTVESYKTYNSKHPNASV